MRVQDFADIGARHDHALVDIEGQAAHIDLVDEIGRGLAGADARFYQLQDLFRLKGGDAGGGKALELVGMKMQRLCDQKRGFGDGISRAMSKDEACLIEAADCEADENEKG